jgi:hypothetical protein
MNRGWLVAWWPRLVAAMVVLVVLAPAAVASYLHAKHVVSRHDEAMAAWLPITTDGMLLAALVVIWARRATRDPAGRWVWLAFWLGGVVTVAANLAAVLPTSGLSLAVEAVVVAVWPPVTVAITLELAMLLAMAIRTAPAHAPVLGPKRPGWWQRKRLVRQWRRQLAAPAPALALDTPAATSSEVPVRLMPRRNPVGALRRRPTRPTRRGPRHRIPRPNHTAGWSSSWGWVTAGRPSIANSSRNSPN